MGVFINQSTFNLTIDNGGNTESRPLVIDFSQDPLILAGDTLANTQPNISQSYLFPFGITGPPLTYTTPLTLSGSSWTTQLGFAGPTSGSEIAFTVRATTTRGNILVAIVEVQLTGPGFHPPLSPTPGPSTQNPATFFAGPVNGSPATAVFRAIQATDIPLLPPSILGNVSAAQFVGGPTTGPAASAAPRALVTTDLPTNRSGVPLVTLTDASTVNIDLSTGSNFYLLFTSAVGASRTLTVSNASKGQKWSLQTAQPASGGPCTATFFGGITWSSGTQPSYSTSANFVDTWEFNTTATTPTFIGSLGGGGGSLPNAAAQTVLSGPLTGSPAVASVLYRPISGALDPRNVNGTGSGAIGGIFDNASHPLSGFYGSLAAAQTAFPGVWITSLNDELAYCTFQAAVNAASNGGKVYIPGSFPTSKPIQVPYKNIEIYGDGATTISDLSPSFGPLPIFFCYPSGYPTPTLGSSLATGPGNSYSLNGNWWINFTDVVATTAYNTLTAMCFECFLDFAALPGSQGTLLYFGGSLGAYTTAAPALRIDVFPAEIVVSLLVNNTTYTLNANLGGLSSLNASHHFEFDWTGTEMMLFVDGISQGSTSTGTGAFSTTQFMDFTIGQLIGYWPDTSIGIVNNLNAKIDGIRFSTAARHTTTASFTPPTSKPTADGTTSIICNFDNINNSILTYYVGPTAIPAYGFFRNDSDLPQGGELYLHDFQTNATKAGYGILSILNPQSTFRNIPGLTANRSFYLWNNCYECVIDNCPSTGTTFGIGLANQSAFTTVINSACNSQTKGVGLLSTEGGQELYGCTFTNNLVAINAKNVVQFKMSNCNFDIEQSGASYGAYFYNINEIQVEGCNADYGFGTNPPFVIDTCGTISFKGGFVAPGGSGFIVGVVNNPGTATPVDVHNTTLSSGAWTAKLVGGVWAADTSLVRFVGIPGTPLVTLTDAASVSINAAISSFFLLPMTSSFLSRTLAISGATPGQKLEIKAQQPASGGPCFVNWPSVTWQGGNPPLLSTAANAIDKVIIEALGTGSSFYGAPVQGNSIITGSLAAWYRFDETTGSTAIDSSGNGNTGTYNGTATSNSVPAAIKFSDLASRSFAGSDYVQIADSAVLDFAGAFYISFWIKTTATSGILVEKNQGNGYSIQLNGSGGLHAFIGNNSVSNLGVTSATINDGNWHNVIFVITSFGSGGGAIYIDGISVALTNNSPATPAYGSSTPLYIGSRASLFGVTATLDDVRLGGVALTAAQAVAIATGVG